MLVSGSHNRPSGDPTPKPRRNLPDVPETLLARTEVREETHQWRGTGVRPVPFSFGMLSLSFFFFSVSAFLRVFFYLYLPISQFSSSFTFGQ